MIDGSGPNEDLTDGVNPMIRNPIRLAAALTVLAACVWFAAPGAADETSGPSYADSWPPANVPIFELPDTIMVEARRYGYGPRQVELLYDYFRDDLSDTLAPRASVYALRPRTRRLSRLEEIAFTADRAANTALFLGGVGHLIGLWDEKTALTMMGAGAALGTIWATTVGGKDSGVRIEVDARNDRE